MSILTPYANSHFLSLDDINTYRHIVVITFRRPTSNFVGDADEALGAWLRINTALAISSIFKGVN